MASVVARAYIGGLEAMPPWCMGSRGKVPGQTDQEAKPPEADSNFKFECALNLTI